MNDDTEHQGDGGEGSGSDNNGGNNEGLSDAAALVAVSPSPTLHLQDSPSFLSKAATVILRTHQRLESDVAEYRQACAQFLQRRMLHRHSPDGHGEEDDLKTDPSLSTHLSEEDMERGESPNSSGSGEGFLQRYQNERMGQIFGTWSSACRSASGCNEDGESFSSDHQVLPTRSLPAPTLHMSTCEVPLFAKVEQQVRQEEAKRHYQALEKYRILRMLRTKKDPAKTVAGCLRYSTIIDQMGIGLISFEDVAPVLMHRCVAYLDRFMKDGSSLLYISLGRVHKALKTCDSTSVLRAVVFLLEGRSLRKEAYLQRDRTQPETLTCIVDLDSHSTFGDFGDLLSEGSNILTGALPCKIKTILLFNAPTCNSASLENVGQLPVASKRTLKNKLKGVSQSVAVSALKLRYLKSSKLRGRTILTNSLLPFVEDIKALHDALLLSGMDGFPA